MQLQELQAELASRSLELESFKGTVDSSEQVFILTLSFKPPTITPFAPPSSYWLFSFALLVCVSSSIPPFCSYVSLPAYMCIIITPSSFNIYPLLDSLPTRV